MSALHTIVNKIISAAALLLVIATCGTVRAQPYAYVTQSGGDYISVIDTANNAVIGTITVGFFSTDVVVNPSGTRAYVVYQNFVAVIDTATNTVLTSIAVRDGPQGITINAAGTRVYVLNTTSGNMSIIDTATNTVVATRELGSTSSPYHIAINPAGTRAYATTSGYNTVAVIDLTSSAPIIYLPVGSLPYDVAVHPDGSRVYVTNATGGSVSVIDAATNTVIGSIGMVDPFGIAINAAGTRAVVANYNPHTASVVDLTTNTVIATLPVGKYPIGVAINPAGTRAYVTATNSFTANPETFPVTVIDLATATVVGETNVGVSGYNIAIGGPAIATVPNAPVIGTATAGFGNATVSFTPPANDGGIPIIDYRVTANPGGLTATGTASPITVSGLTAGIAYTFTVTAANSIGTSVSSAPSNSVTPIGLNLLGVQSRKTHAATGAFDLVLDTTQLITGAVTVEPRGLGSGHLMVFQFDAPITSAGTVSAVNGSGATLAATATLSGNSVIVTLPTVPDNSRATVTLSNVNGTLSPPPVSIGYLVGDVNNSRSVNASDISGVKARSGQVTSALNFRFDVNASGAVNASDISAVKARSGLVLAP